MPWLKHYPGPKGLGDTCASAKCEGVPSWRLEAHGVGSFYCQDCKEKIDGDHHWIDLEDPKLPQQSIQEAITFTFRTEVQRRAFHAVLKRRIADVHSFDSWADTVLELDRLRKIEAAAVRLLDSLQCGFIVCQTCGDQETTTDLDDAKELRIALGLDPDLTVVDPLPF